MYTVSLPYARIVYPTYMYMYLFNAPKFIFKGHSECQGTL